MISTALPAHQCRSCCVSRSHRERHERSSSSSLSCSSTSSSITSSTSIRSRCKHQSTRSIVQRCDGDVNTTTSRRQHVISSFPMLALVMMPSPSARQDNVMSNAAFAAEQEIRATSSSGNDSRFESMPALAGKDYGKARTLYPDFTLAKSGIQYKDLAPGSGEAVIGVGNKVVCDWSGYTIGYYGRIFEVWSTKCSNYSISLKCGNNE